LDRKKRKTLMMTSFKAALAVAAIGMTGALTATDASASTGVTYEFSYPGTQCNSFGAAGMGPNAGAELVNWSNPNPVLVECPFVRDSTLYTVNNTAYLDYSSGVKCSEVFMDSPGQGGVWAFAPASQSFQNGCNTYNWGFDYTNGTTIGGAAIECSLSELGTIIDYRVNTYFRQDPGN
jgi:hypothetical protein